MGNFALGHLLQCTTSLYFPKFIYFYWPQQSCGQGYVFTRVCDSVHRGGGLWRTPPDQGEPPRIITPPPRTKENPPGPGRTPPSPPERPPPGPRRTPRTRENPPLQANPSAAFHERPVRILLECILVLGIFFHNYSKIQYFSMTEDLVHILVVQKYW